MKNKKHKRNKKRNNGSTLSEYQMGKSMAEELKKSSKVLSELLCFVVIAVFLGFPVLAILPDGFVRDPGNTYSEYIIESDDGGEEDDDEEENNYDKAEEPEEEKEEKEKEDKTTDKGADVSASSDADAEEPTTKLQPAHDAEEDKDKDKDADADADADDKVENNDDSENTEMKNSGERGEGEDENEDEDKDEDKAKDENEVKYDLLPSNAADGSEFTVALFRTKENKTVIISLEEYVTGVVAAEMSYHKDEEALRAQAVAARTFCLYRSGRYHSEKGADVCDNSGHCSAYYSYEDLCDLYGEKTAKAAYEAAGKAAADTKGIIMTYKGDPICACYFDNCSGRTENADEVWGGSAPYLVSVTTPEKAGVRKYTYKSAELMSTLFGKNWKMLSSRPSGSTILDSAGKPRRFTLYGNTISAQKLKSKLSLRSPDVKIVYDNESDEFTISAYGYGHLVGMSQEGAEVYAKMGWNWFEILSHYYTGIDFTYLYKK